MFETIKKWLGLQPKQTVIDFDNLQMIVEDDAIEAFTDPNQLPANAALTLIDAVIGHRPDAKELREALIVRFVNENGIDMHGSLVSDKVTGIEGHPDINPDKLFIYPYARPTAGSTVMPSYTDALGETYVAMVRNWKDSNNHALGAEDDWRFPGGYLNPRSPIDPDQKDYDQNLQASAIRELKEELNLTVNANQLTEKLVKSESGAERNHPNHAIDSFYLADLGSISNHVGEASIPELQAGDDVANAAWVNIRDIQPNATAGYQVTVNGETRAFRQDHAELLEKGIQDIRARRMPLADSPEFGSPLSAEAFDFYDKAAQAHGLNDAAKPRRSMLEMLQQSNAPALGGGQER